MKILIKYNYKFLPKFSVPFFSPPNDIKYRNEGVNLISNLIEYISNFRRNSRYYFYLRPLNIRKYKNEGVNLIHQTIKFDRLKLGYNCMLQTYNKRLLFGNYNDNKSFVK